jgi:diguanylate cyclase (GGDEF)-like protein
MYRVVSCLVTEHDSWLVLLAVVVCVATALTSFLMYSIADMSSDRPKLLWAALTGVSAGSGIWATHFVAMLAYQGALPTQYEPVATIGSLLIAITFAAVGFAAATGSNRWWTMVGGIIIGFAIGTMHFVGMTALVIPGTTEWDTTLVTASWILGCVIAATAMLTFHARSGTQAIVCAGALLATAICVLHFTAMGAVTIHPDPTVAFEGIGMNRTHLALAIAAVTLIVLLSAFAAAVVQQANFRYAAALHEQNTLFEAALRFLPVGFSMFDGDQCLIMCNPAYRQLYRLAEEATRGGTHFADIVANLAQRQGHDGTDCSVARHLRKLGDGAAFTETVLLDDGRTIFKKVGPIAGGGWVDVQEDITERIEQDAKIAYMAQHDMLTGLPNRTQLVEHIDHALKWGRRGDKVCVLFIDLDRFKNVNDTLGHLMGDELLKAVANRLRDNVRKPDLVARLGGDEFVVLQVTPQPSQAAADLASRLIASLSEPFVLNGHILEIGASVGIAVSRDGPEDSGALLARADTALYQQKAAGGTGYCFFNEGRARTREIVVYKPPQPLPLAS